MKSFTLIPIMASITLLSVGCATAPHDGQSERISALEIELEDSKNALKKEREKAPLPVASNGQLLLPPNAKAGECYARVWVDPQYKTLTKKVLVQEESERVDIIEAQYEWVTEDILTKEASTALKKIPAKYKTITEQVLLSPSSRHWKTALYNGKPVSENILRAAESNGIDLTNTKPNTCYHEHVIPAKVEQKQKEIEVAPASFKILTKPAEYRWIEKRILVKEASSKLVNHDAVYKTVTEQIIDKPAHTTWKKGTGPIQKIDDATGEIMCLVNIPATYKTIQRQELVTPARTEMLSIPAEYKTVKVQELVSEASESKQEISAKYTTITVDEKTGDDRFIWHEVHDKSMNKESRTGNQICLVETPAKYKTVTKTVRVSPATTETITIPATYEKQKVRKLISDAKESRTVIPAKYETVTYNEISKNGYMDWRTILCETNMSSDLVFQLQKKLNQKGYNAGTEDGAIGFQTMSAVNQYQQDNNLPVDKYLNIETMKHLNLL